MPRRISKQLLARLSSGDLKPLLDYIKQDKQLRLEVRFDGKAFVYYRKGKALEIRAKSFSFPKEYNKDERYPTPDINTAKSNSEGYFKQMKLVIDHYVKNVKTRAEFDTQQNIASSNGSKDDKYLILDMEYNFSQSGLDKAKREKRAGFDLLGIERSTGKVIFFEVKKGGSALKGKSGITGHIDDFETYLYGRNKEFYRKAVQVDVLGILSDKKELGICDYSLPPDFQITDDNIDFIFVYEPDKSTPIERYEKIFEEEQAKATSTRKYQTIYVSEANAYKLD